MMQINSNRLWGSLMEMAAISPGLSGGCNRLALTKNDALARNMFKQQCEQAGLVVTADDVGNIFARREGINHDAPAIYMGSHLDTQPTGGKFDGALGVLGALEVMRTLNENNATTELSIVAVNWTDEEGVRFSSPMLGSGAFAGMYSREQIYSLTDKDGLRFDDELRSIGWLGENPVGQSKIATYYELHIEQGPILEAENKLIGVVTHAQGLNWLEIKLHGRESHSGTTPMKMRLNAGLGMARIIECVDKISHAHAPYAVGTVGRCNVYPNAINTVPGSAIFTIDFRHPDKSVIEVMNVQLREQALKIAEIIGLDLEIKQIGQFDPVRFSQKSISIVRSATERLGYSNREIISGAGHDACLINRVAPTSMIMCPCEGGLSHNEAENITKEWAAAGTNVLLHAVLDSANPGE